MTGQLTWLVTGCSSGLGEALVHAILAKGDRVIATARYQGISGIERLAPLKDSGAAVLEIDVTATQDVLNAKAKESWEVYGQVDVLVSNAGNILIKSLQRNVIGPLNLVRAFLPYMRQRGSGTLLFMSTVGVYYGIPGASCYSASKGVLDGVVPDLALEIAPFGLRTCLLTPDYFRTSLMAPGNIRSSTAARSLPEYAEMNRNFQEDCNSGNGTQQGDSKKAAEVVLDAMRAEGRCEGKTLSAMLPLGPDGIQGVRASCEEKIRICDEWDEIALATNIEPQE